MHRPDHYLQKQILYIYNINLLLCEHIYAIHLYLQSLSLEKARLFFLLVINLCFRYTLNTSSSFKNVKLLLLIISFTGIEHIGCVYVCRPPSLFLQNK